MWRRALFKGSNVWAEVDASGELRQQGGRVAIRYSASEGAKLYRAGVSRVEVNVESESVELPAGVGAGESGPKKSSPSPRGFGSANTRTQQQKAMAVDAAKALLAALPANAVVCYTDGSCRGNPGPAGAGALVVLSDGQRGESCADLGHGTNNVAELTAIKLALELLDEAAVDAEHPVALLSDSSYANGVLCRGWKAKKNRELINVLREMLAARPGVRLHWVAGHAGIDGNERADELANQGAEGLTVIRWE